MKKSHELVIDQTWDGKKIPISEMTYIRFSEDSQILAITAEGPFHNDPLPMVAPGPTPKLWEYEVTELFLLGADGSYVEIEIGPAGHYLILILSEYRRPKTTVDPLRIETITKRDRFKASLHLPMSKMPKRPWRANAYAIHGTGDYRKYLACHRTNAPDVKAPDFHRLSSFKPV